MNKSLLLPHALALAAMFAFPLAQAAPMNKADYTAGKTRITTQYKSDKAACASLTANAKDVNNAYGYAFAAIMVKVLEQCGADVTRETIMKQATNLRDWESPMLLPGIRINTSPTDYFPIEQMRMARFDGEKWALFGDLLSPRGV